VNASNAVNSFTVWFEINGYLNNDSGTCRLSHPPSCYTTLLIRACFAVYSYGLSPLHVIVNWPVFTILFSENLKGVMIHDANFTKQTHTVLFHYCH